MHFYLLFSQLLPLYPSTQEHEYTLPSPVQSPLCKQGLGLHGPDPKHTHTHTYL